MLRRKRFWLGLIISLLFLGFFLARTDFGEIQEAFGGANYFLAFAAVPLYFVSFWIRTVRWHYLLRPVRDIATLRLYPVVLIGLMTNNLAPARVGELVRAYLLGERETMNKSTALGTIAVDRAFDGLTLVAMLGIVTAFSDVDSGVKRIGIATAVLFLAAASFLVALAMSPQKVKGLLLRLIAMLPERLARRAEDILDAFLVGLVAIRSPSVLIRAAVASSASWLIEGSMYYVIGEAFNLGVGFHVYLIIVAGANLALSILQTPGGIGPFEVATREVLVFFNVASASASAYALALHAILLAPVILVGFLLLWTTRFSFSQIMGVEKRTAAPAPGAGIE
ncbi:MAG: flippase-like domain-containing protein [Dehalococcoidia bacterium]|nr:flippase-like domain-containing protein [Dehalococcoidia bacterium]